MAGLALIITQPTYSQWGGLAQFLMIFGAIAILVSAFRGNR